jgi:hypothetical protein
LYVFSCAASAAAVDPDAARGVPSVRRSCERSPTVSRGRASTLSLQRLGGTVPGLHGVHGVAVFQAVDLSFVRAAFRPSPTDTVFRPLGQRCCEHFWSADLSPGQGSPLVDLSGTACELLRTDGPSTIWSAALLTTTADARDVRVQPRQACASARPGFRLQCAFAQTLISLASCSSCSGSVMNAAQSAEPHCMRVSSTLLVCQRRAPVASCSYCWG